MSEDSPKPYASSPCMAHELEPSRAPSLDVALWRRAERKRHLDARMALPLTDRVMRDRQIAATLTQTIGNAKGLTVSAYWPIRCEPDLRPLLAELTDFLLKHM